MADAMSQLAEIDRARTDMSNVALLTRGVSKSVQL
jgi:hypothetical protein